MSSLPLSPTAKSGAERRRERRYEVEIKGELEVGDEFLPVTIADLSASGALVMTSNPPPAGTIADLWIEDFGAVTVEIMHSGDNFCGVALADPAADRDDLLEWLAEDTDQPAV